VFRGLQKASAADSSKHLSIEGRLGEIAVYRIALYTQAWEITCELVCHFEQQIF